MFRRLQNAIDDAVGQLPEFLRRDTIEPMAVGFPSVYHLSFELFGTAPWSYAMQGSSESNPTPSARPLGETVANNFRNLGFVRRLEIGTLLSAYINSAITCWILRKNLVDGWGEKEVPFTRRETEYRLHEIEDFLQTGTYSSI